MGHCHDDVVSGLINERDLCRIREAVCTQVEKVYDSCKEKDCVENARVLFKCPQKVQWIINKAINVKFNRAEVLDVYADIEPVPFKRGFYTVDLKFFIKVMLNFFVPCRDMTTKIIPINGLVLFDKKVVLFGSEGNVKIFKSLYVRHGIDNSADSTLQQDNMPVSKVEVAEPIALGAKIQDISDKCFDNYCCGDNIPRNIMESMGEEKEEDYRISEVLELEESADDTRFPQKRVVVTVGLFSIIKLVRNVQLLIPAFDFCIPDKKCVASVEDDPCNLFEAIDFPVDEFAPPQKFDFPGAEEQEHATKGEKECD
jgi:hypothetical protein